MKRLSFLLLLLAGCSTAPVADVMDYFKPGRIVADKSAPRGGVCGPQQPGPPVVGAAPMTAPIFRTAQALISPPPSGAAPVFPPSTPVPPTVNTTTSGELPLPPLRFPRAANPPL